MNPPGRPLSALNSVFFKKKRSLDPVPKPSFISTKQRRIPAKSGISDTAHYKVPKSVQSAKKIISSIR